MIIRTLTWKTSGSKIKLSSCTDDCVHLHIPGGTAAVSRADLPAFIDALRVAAGIKAEPTGAAG